MTRLYIPQLRSSLAWLDQKILEKFFSSTLYTLTAPGNLCHCHIVKSSECFDLEGGRDRYLAFGLTKLCDDIDMSHRPWRIPTMPLQLFKTKAEAQLKRRSGRASLYSSTPSKLWLSTRFWSTLATGFRCPTTGWKYWQAGFTTYHSSHLDNHTNLGAHDLPKLRKSSGDRNVGNNLKDSTKIE